jgi:uncharacterized protein YqgC (DUF456 family)
MAAAPAELLKLLAYLGIALGLVGIFVPVLPGTILVFGSMLLWAWADGFQHLGWPSLAALAGLTLVAEGARYLLQSLGARAAGATWKGVLASAVGALAGFLFFSLPGAILGAVGALLLVDYRQHEGEWRQAGKLTVGVLLGYVASYAVQFAIALVMVAIFAYNVLAG